MKSPKRNYILTDEHVEVLLDRLSRFHDDDDARAVGEEIARQQNHDPNHVDNLIKHINS